MLLPVVAADQQVHASDWLGSNCLWHMKAARWTPMRARSQDATLKDELAKAGTAETATSNLKVTICTRIPRSLSEANYGTFRPQSMRVLLPGDRGVDCRRGRRAVCGTWLSPRLHASLPRSVS